MNNVLNLGDYRFTRANTRDPFKFSKDCRHKHLTLDSNGEIVKCDDCKAQVGAFWALQMIVASWDDWYSKLQRARDDAQKVASSQVVLKAALVVQDAWRSRTMAPTCPHCQKAILATDGFGRSRVNKEMELARRKRAASSEDSGV